MVFRLLGPLEVVDGRMPVALPGGKARALLARLVLDVNRTVPVQRLVDDLWGDAAPASAVKMVQIYVSQLRKSLPAAVLRTRPPGYIVEIEPEAVDVTRFAGLRGEGRAALAGGDAASASTLLRDALALWRGPALAEFPEPFAAIEAAHLEELRLACLEDRIRADLDLGRHADLVGELESLVARHPLREALHRELMLALYRAGRQAEALASYERFRRTLDDELGIEPSATLKALQYRILNQDRSLEPAAGDVVPVAAAPRGNGAGSVAPPRPEPAAAAPEFVGRDAELGRLEQALASASAARGSAMLIAGRAGIGKTRLASELAERASARGATVLRGRCIQLVGLGIPYLPLVDALRPLRGSPALDALPVQLGELARLVPEVAGAAATAPAESARSDSRLRLFEEVRAVLEHLGAAAPVVLVLEDLHWADESTLDLVAFLVHAVSERRILLVATYRSDEIRPGDHLHRLTTGLVGGGAAGLLTLGPLARDELAALLTAGSGDALAPELVAAIASRSEGNPFYARELLAAAARGETTLPPALRDVLLARVARLDADGHAVLRAVAAAGRAVPYALLAAVVAAGERELAGALREAVELDVLVADQAAGTFRFRHELFAEAVYGTLLPGEREVLHERLARALGAAPALAVSGAAAGELAQHWAAAGRPVEALEASLEAARDAEAVSGLTEALRHVERVLELWDAVPGAEQLAGVALPSVLAWAAELAGLSVQREDELAARVLVGFLGPGQSLEVETVAARLGVSMAAAAATLAALERNGQVERLADGVFRSAPLAVKEARRLYPSAVVLESLAVRQSPPLDRAALEALRAANERLRAARDDAEAAVADDDFHRTLTAGCGNEHLLRALLPVKRALLRYERVYMRERERIERSAAQHDAIIRALERGDHAEAAQRVRENLAGGIPDLREALER
jgi:DNA-binding SARP family transcriptional activator/DNA-binding GntR family transcriptional regulator